MNHGTEIERIAAEYGRRSAALIEDLADANARTAAASRELAARSAERLAALTRELAAASGRADRQAETAPATATEPDGKQPRAPHRSPGAHQPEPIEHAPGRHRAPAADDPVTVPIPIQRGEEPAGTDEERRARELRENRAAIARSIAARRAANVVTPVDQGDEESEYYRRTSWLI